jgi:hypothetical protein
VVAVVAGLAAAGRLCAQRSRTSVCWRSSGTHTHTPTPTRHRRLAASRGQRAATHTTDPTTLDERSPAEHLSPAAARAAAKRGQARTSYGKLGRGGGSSGTRLCCFITARATGICQPLASCSQGLSEGHPLRRRSTVLRRCAALDGGSRLRHCRCLSKYYVEHSPHAIWLRARARAAWLR